MISDERETFIELATATLLGMIFMFWLAGRLPQSFAMLLGGLILLGSGVYQSRRGWHVSLVTWVLGIVLTLGGLGLRLFLVSVVRINWIPMALLLIALYLVWSWWHRR